MMLERMKAYRPHSPEARPMCCRGETLSLHLASHLPLDDAGCERMSKPERAAPPSPQRYESLTRVRRLEKHREQE
jgi:hypothetical protein